MAEEQTKKLPPSEAPLTCPHCLKVFVSAQGLGGHIRYKHPEVHKDPSLLVLGVLSGIAALLLLAGIKMKIPAIAGAK